MIFSQFEIQFWRQELKNLFSCSTTGVSSTRATRSSFPRRSFSSSCSRRRPLSSLPFPSSSSSSRERRRSTSSSRRLPLSPSASSTRKEPSCAVLSCRRTKQKKQPPPPQKKKEAKDGRSTLARRSRVRENSSQSALLLARAIDHFLNFFSFLFWGWCLGFCGVSLKKGVKRSLLSSTTTWTTAPPRRPRRHHVRKMRSN